MVKTFRWSAAKCTTFGINRVILKDEELTPSPKDIFYLLMNTGTKHQ